VVRSAHECGHSGEDLGGIPVMVLFGDDYQLPSIGNSGATDIPQLNKNGGVKGLHDITQCQGGIQFMHLAEEVIELDQVFVRQRLRYYSRALSNVCVFVG
jgi:hypothetical protein